MVDELVEDIREAIDACMDQVITVRSRLLGFCADWPEDRGLGSVFDLGLSTSESEFVGLIDSLAARDGPSRLLQRVTRAETALDRLTERYREGRYAPFTVAEWRSMVEEAYGALAQALECADEGLSAWSELQASMEGPDSTVLKDKDYIFAEDFVRMWRGELSLDAARRRISSGKYGVPIPMGKYNALEKNNMRETLLRQGLEEADSQGGQQARELLKRFPRKRRPRRSKASGSAESGGQSTAADGAGASRGEELDT